MSNLEKFLEQFPVLPKDPKDIRRSCVYKNVPKYRLEYWNTFSVENPWAFCDLTCFEDDPLETYWALMRYQYWPPLNTSVSSVTDL